MLKLATAALLPLAFLLVPISVHADAWTDGQAEWARHGSRHGQWDCYGACPNGRPTARTIPRRIAPVREQARRGGGFDGAWVVSAGGYCAGAGTSQVLILGGRVTGQNVTGTVSPGGFVRTVGVLNGMSIVSSGRISGGLASGIYRQSDGCWGNWSAYRS